MHFPPMAQSFPPYALDPSCVPAQQQYGLVREVETLHWLMASLPASYVVFHSTHIAWMDESRLRNREADFLIVNQAGQILMVEQKTGRLEETAAGLYKSYGADAKSVVLQCQEVIEGLRESFRRANGKEARIEIRFLLYCPDHSIRNPAATGIVPEQIVDARRARALPQVIRQLLPERPPNASQFGLVRRMLSQEVQFDADRDVRAKEGERVVTRLTGDLLDFLGALEMSPYRLRVEGTAGCGKTQMISRFAEQARADGKRCLVACFNRLLADDLRASLPAEIVVDTLHGLARRILEAKGEPPDMAGAGRPGFFADMVAKATDKALEGLNAEWMFDALIVDEGQDIDQDGFDLLKLLLQGDASVVWLQDEKQRLYGGRSFSEPGFVGYRCRDNYRSPARIARFIKALLGADFDVRNPLPGDAVQIIEATPEALLDRLGERVQKLVEDGFLPSQIVVLTGKGMMQSAVMQAPSIGGHATRRLVGHEADGTPRFSAGTLQVETLWRFKGRQAPVILLCELDGSLEDAFTRSRLYVAATRATYHLEVLLPRASSLTPVLHSAVGRSVQ